MNLRNPMETGANPEQQIREEMLHDIFAQSEGTVGLRMFMDLESDERASMIEAQSARSGQPAEVLYSNRGGGLNYGERELPGMVASTIDTDSYNRVPETVFFVEGPEDTVDVQYRFTSSDYRDDTGRPGNALQMAFSLPKDGALKLREALHADPSFINQVVERQVAAIGIDTSSNAKRWMRMNPATHSETKGGERQLVIGDGKVDGEQVSVLQSESIAYGENRSLLAMHTPEAPVTTPEQATPATTPEQQDLGMKPEDFDKEVAERFAGDKAYVDQLRASGTSLDELITKYQEDAVEAQRILNTHEGTVTDYDSLNAIFTAEGRILKELLKEKEATQKQTDVDAARGNLEAALQTQEATNLNTVTVDGKPYTVIERYNAANTDKTPYVVVRDAQGNEKHVKASELGK